MRSSLNPIRHAFVAPSSDRRRPAIFLDRDGVINDRIWGGYVTHWTEFRFLEGIVPVLRALDRLQLPIIVVSNQSGLNRGLLGRSSLRQITARFVHLLARHGARIDAVYYCPHTDEDRCSCRKPKPGLLLHAARDYRIDLSRSVLVGDEPRDIEAAAAAGCRGVLLGPSGVPGWGTVSLPSELPERVAAILNRVLP